MVPFAGYGMPVQYDPPEPFAARCRGGVMAEHLHCRAQAALFDVSHMGQIHACGRARRRGARTAGAGRYRGFAAEPAALHPVHQRGGRHPRRSDGRQSWRRPSAPRRQREPQGGRFPPPGGGYRRGRGPDGARGSRPAGAARPGCRRRARAARAGGGGAAVHGSRARCASAGPTASSRAPATRARTGWRSPCPRPRRRRSPGCCCNRRRSRPRASAPATRSGSKPGCRSTATTSTS